jgi:hypothetical protein
MRGEQRLGSARTPRSRPRNDHAIGHRTRRLCAVEQKQNRPWRYAKAAFQARRRGLEPPTTGSTGTYGVPTTPSCCSKEAVSEPLQGSSARQSAYSFGPVSPQSARNSRALEGPLDGSERPRRRNNSAHVPGMVSLSRHVDLSGRVRGGPRGSQDALWEARRCPRRRVSDGSSPKNSL